MRSARVTAVRLAILALALGGLLGAECGGGEQQTWVALVADANSVEVFSPLTVDVQISSPEPIQAFELGLKWDPAMLSGFAVFPHPEFDDDGGFFTSPSWDFPAGRLDRVVDLRHGGEGAEGNFKVATLWLMSRGSAGSTSIELTSGGLADGNGAEPSVTKVVPVTITIEP
jgi:hypothetical protein